MIESIMKRVKETMPLVHNITNYVTVNDVANALLACGARPIMSDEPDDVVDITSICDGLNLNIGTLNKYTIRSMYTAGIHSNLLHHPVLLDPVGAGASVLRTNTALNLLQTINLTAIRGNISEIKTLALGNGTTKGVDADIADTVTEKNLDTMISFVKNFSKKSNTIIVVTGAIDLVADASTCYVIRNGRQEMSRVTGTGCQLSAIITAYLAANPDNLLAATATAVCLMGLAGEIGYATLLPGEGNATYRNRIIDAIYNIDAVTLQRGARYEIR